MSMPTDAGAVLEALRRACGAAPLLTGSSEVAPYLSDHRQLYRGRALGVALPDSVAQLSGILACCNTLGIGVVPQGGNTSYCGGATPDDSGRQLLIGLARMNRIRAIDAANFSMTVEAGCLLANVQQAAAGVGCYFPLELGSAGSCQIGGNLSTNAGGLNVLRFGMARDLTLGIEAVLADGRVLQRLRGLRKDNTGYDLKSLLIGAEGTLGIITAATLKLWPAIRTTATAFLAVTDVNAAIAVLAQLRSAAGERLNSFELLPRTAIELACRHIPDTLAPLGLGSEWYVLCELSSFVDEPLDELLQQTLTRAISAGLVLDATLAANERQRRAFWALREGIPAAQRRAGLGVKHDISVPVSALPAFVAEASTWVQHAVPEGTLLAYGHAGDGNLHFNINWLAGADAQHVATQEPVIRRAIHDLVAAHGGSISAEHGIGQLKVDELRRYTSAVELDTMRAIKRALDPRGIMNPGKVFESTGSFKPGS
jgi:FAD/FMN-containing dehydrogenase